MLDVDESLGDAFAIPETISCETRVDGHRDWRAAGPHARTGNEPRMSRDVFISFARGDRELAAYLARKLDERGVSAWYDATLAAEVSTEATSAYGPCEAEADGVRARDEVLVHVRDDHGAGRGPRRRWCCSSVVI